MVVSKSTPQWVVILKQIRLPMVGRSRKAVLGGGVVASSVFQYGKLFVESLRAKCLASSLTLKVYTDPSTSLLWWQCIVKGADLLGLKQTRVLSTNKRFRCKVKVHIQTYLV